MRTAILVGLAMVLAACVEVTRFKDGDNDVFLADCEARTHLQSCRAALDSACPNGYDLIGPVMRREGAEMVATRSGYFRCR